MKEEAIFDSDSFLPSEYGTPRHLAGLLTPQVVGNTRETEHMVLAPNSLKSRWRDKTDTHETMKEVILRLHLCRESRTDCFHHE